MNEPRIQDLSMILRFGGPPGAQLIKMTGVQLPSDRPNESEGRYYNL
jgi:hypothetical protein